MTATLGVAAASWVVAMRQMSGMDMGVATRLGSFAPWVALWVVMMAAMMLPGAVPAIVRRAHARGARAVPPFVASYLAVWALVGVAVYALYLPHGSISAGVVVLAAGIYELTPLKRYFRGRCGRNVRSGWELGYSCVGSSMGLMLVMVALGVMSITWMSVITVVATAQKLLPPKAALDVALAGAVIGLGLLVLLAPGLTPGLTPPM